MVVWKQDFISPVSLVAEPVGNLLECVRVDGGIEFTTASDGWVRLRLKGDKKVAPSLLLVDRVGSQQ